MKHLLVDISGHGFGHLAQVAPTLNALNAISKEESCIRVTLRSSLPEALLKTKISLPFNYIHTELDKGMIMHDAMGVDEVASYDWYEQFHCNYSQKVDEQAHQLAELKPDLLYADIPYISLDAAHLAGIQSIALCSLNWADIFYAYCKHQPKAKSIYEEIVTAYNKASYFLQPVPSMDMPDVLNSKSIAPIAESGNRQKEKLLICSHNTDQTRFVLISLGGIDTKLAVDTLPVIENVNWIVPDSITSARKDMIIQSTFQMPYIDLLSSVDLIVTKTGYGAMVEAVSHQIPMLCISRPEWPEEPNLFTWCKQHGHFETMRRDELLHKDFAERIENMLDVKWQKPLIIANGDQQVADILSGYLS